MRTARSGFLRGSHRRLPVADHSGLPAFQGPQRSAAGGNRRRRILYPRLASRLCDYGLLLERGLPIAVAGIGRIERRLRSQRAGRRRETALRANDAASETSRGSRAAAWPQTARTRAPRLMWASDIGPPRSA